jgi:hypothetical protein
MSFCANCGRPRDGAARFCADCGTELTGTTPVAENQAEDRAPQDPAPEDRALEDPAPEELASAGSQADATLIDSRAAAPGEHTDPFASWYRPEQQAGAATSPSPAYGPTQTVGVGSGSPGGYQPAGYQQPGGYQAHGYPPPLTPPAPPFAPVPPAGGPPRRRGLFALLALVVVLAVGGGAYALAAALGGHSTTSAGGAASSPAPVQSTAGQSATASTPATPASASASPTPSPALSLVSVAPGVTSSAEPQVETLLSHYFEGINKHDFTEYAATLTAAQRAKQSTATFTAGYSTTTDSGMTLTSLTSSGSGLVATVTFTSHQAAAQSIDKSPCNNWTLNLYLSAAGSAYLIGAAPAGYQPDHSDC